MKGSRPPVLMILGSSGNVARAFLLRLLERKPRLGGLVLVDPCRPPAPEPWASARAAGAVEVRARVGLPHASGAYESLLRRHRAGILLDLTGEDTLPLLRATDALGVPYLNTTLSDRGVPLIHVVEETFGAAERFRGAPHILSSGMNPGVVNLWACHAVARHGVPREIVFFEVDDSMTADRWRPVITWSPAEYLLETAIANAGYASGGRMVEFPRCPFRQREPMRGILEPVFRWPRYPEGLLVMHDENVILPRRFGTASKFLYSLHPRTMKHLVALFRRRGRLETSDLVLCDNVSRPLTGADLVGVMLDYGSRRVYYYNALANAAVRGTNATCAQVVAGVWAALRAVLEGRLARRVHFAGDLLGTCYEKSVFRDLATTVCALKRRGGRWTVESRGEAAA